MKIKTKSPQETRELAANVAKKLKVGDVLALIGELGSGKTNFVQGLAFGLRVDSKTYVRSPTFTLINEYTGKIPLYHVDFYRLKTGTELDTLGIDDYIYGEGVTVIEWADRFPQTLPENTIYIHFEILGENDRGITIRNCAFLDKVKL